MVSKVIEEQKTGWSMKTHLVSGMNLRQIDADILMGIMQAILFTGIVWFSLGFFRFGNFHIDTNPVVQCSVR